MKSLNYRERLASVQKIMNEMEIDLFLLTPSVNFRYLFKGNLQMRERLICAAIQPNQDPILTAPTFEKERMELTTNIDHIVGWKEEEIPYEKLVNTLDISPKNIALEPTMRFETFTNFRNILSNANFLNGGDILSKLRAKKTPAEVQRIKKACTYTVQTIEDTLSTIEVGISEIALQKLLIKRMTELSGEMSWALVQFDENSAIPHGHATEKKIKSDSIFLIDAGTSIDGYFSDITITTCLGKPKKEFLDIYEIVQKANDAALDKSKEGIPAEEVDQAARDIIENAGYGKYFTHRLGHGLGLEVHEEPYIVKGNSELLQTGNIHTDEPGIYLPDKFGIRIEDDIYVKENKSERIFDFNRIFWDE